MNQNELRNMLKTLIQYSETEICFTLSNIQSENIKVSYDALNKQYLLNNNGVIDKFEDLNSIEDAIGKLMLTSIA